MVSFFLPLIAAPFFELIVGAAACFLHLKLYPRCIEYCSDALDLDSQCAKALFRRARAFRLQDKLDEAKADLMKLHGIVSNNAQLIEVERELELLQDSKQKYDASSREFAQKALR